MKITKNLERNWRKGSSLLLMKGLEFPKAGDCMDDLNKDENIHDRETQKKLPHQPLSSSNSVFPIASGIIRDQLPKDKLAIGVGVFSSMFAAGSVVGLAVGGSIINNFGWHATFLSIVPVAISLWVIINRFIHGDNKRAEVVEKE